MKIKPYTYSPSHLAEIIDLINYCQNIEAHLNIKMSEQPDLFEIENYYQHNHGNFWTALDGDQVIGTIALLPISSATAVLKKFFTYPKYRGQPHHLGQQLFNQLEQHAIENKFKEIILDTPENEHRSHTFYEHHGFIQIKPEQMTVSYPFPDRNSRIYLKQL
ncbi:GNAT family N-acetyltransferase [Lentilactobacillus sp. SPB1-3]|uniref:GNAT family N-acetyltransferase n=1 Tax=Lentilactobacillus terminaliae TaxID=3003483 RepID=A0ACD5DGZ5_9LACO|nr:GNAT family N-acetyltransferase [Lentilactobacillus sp. SPB1-3]